jgi:hypothetical protein
MNPFRPLDQVLGVDEVSTTHRELLQGLADLRDAPDLESSQLALLRIRASLTHHFRMEEHRDGVFDWICALAPDQGDTVTALLHDHEALLVEAKALRPGFTEDGAPDDEARVRIDSFAEHLKQHERTESAAMQAALRSAER